MKGRFVIFSIATAVLSLCGGGIERAGAQHVHILHFDKGETDQHVHREPGPALTRSFMGGAPRFGLAIQRGLFAEAGVSLDLYRIGYTPASEYVSFGYRNARPYLSGEILIDGKKLLGGGKAGFEFIMSTPLFGMAVGADASYYTDGGADAVTLTPRLMFSFVYVEIFYGYNFFVRNDLRQWIGHHRFGVSMTLDGRFWKRKKEIYGDYYNTYL